MKNLWILTEERPKKNVLASILSLFAKDQGCGYFGGHLTIIPLLDEAKCFDFTYEVIGFKCASVRRIYIKTISGSSSFVDYLIFHQDQQPTQDDKPLYAIEETKTDDKESRNTGVFQRCSKFVFIRNYYPDTKFVMLYALQIEQKTDPTDTYIFGTRLLLTLGVVILGKVLDEEIYTPFTSVDELIAYKNNMHRPPAGNVPIIITKSAKKIQISGRLFKSGTLSHDPNIGALSIIAAVIRKLGWEEEIEITGHGLQQEHVGSRNKFIQIANILRIKLQGLIVPMASIPQQYWHYETQGEKLGTIFIHIVVETFTESYSIFENHAGCEKGYFQTSDGQHIPLAKYSDREAYKAGDKDKIVNIPDLVLLDIADQEAVTIEGKQYKYRRKGIEELANYDEFENIYLNKYYPNYTPIRTVVLYGSREESVIEVEVGFLLNENGKPILGINAPKLFRQALHNLLDYWNCPNIS